MERKGPIISVAFEEKLRASATREEVIRAFEAEIQALGYAYFDFGSLDKQRLHEASLRALLAPFEKTADLCRMRYLAPFALFGAGRAIDEGRDAPHTRLWQSLLSALLEDRLDIDAARNAPLLNEIAAQTAARPEQ